MASLACSGGLPPVSAIHTLFLSRLHFIHLYKRKIIAHKIQYRMEFNGWCRSKKSSAVFVRDSMGHILKAVIIGQAHAQSSTGPRAQALMLALLNWLRDETGYRLRLRKLSVACYSYLTLQIVPLTRQPQESLAIVLKITSLYCHPNLRDVYSRHTKK